MKKTVTRAVAEAALDGYDGWEKIEEQIIDHDRWTVTYTAVSKDKDDNHWQYCYSVGATEQQDQAPFEYDDDIEFTLVEKRLVTTEAWVPVI